LAGFNLICARVQIQKVFPRGCVVLLKRFLWLALHDADALAVTRQFAEFGANMRELDLPEFSFLEDLWPATADNSRQIRRADPGETSGYYREGVEPID
jgi:hypothetical protein